jgi:copper ion binding protein
MPQIETYDVAGMTCDHCVRAVTEEVTALEGVCHVDVDLASGQVKVTTLEPVPVTKIREAVAEAGYALA